MGRGGSKHRWTPPDRHTTTVTVSPESPPLLPFVQVDFQDNVHIPPAQHNLQWHAMGGGSSTETISTTSTFKTVCTVPFIDPPQHFADVDFQVKSYNPNTEYLDLFKDESDDGYGSMDRLSPRESLQPKRIHRFPTPEVCDYILSMNCKDTLNILYIAKELHTHTPHIP